MKKKWNFLIWESPFKAHRAWKAHLTLLCRSYIWYMPTTQGIFDLNLIEVKSK